MSRDVETNDARPPTAYVDLGVFTGRDGWAVRVQTTQNGRPRYSYEVGKVRDGKFLRFVPAGVEIYDGEVFVPELDLAALQEALHVCYAKIKDDAKRREDLFRAGRGPRPAGGSRPSGGRSDRHSYDEREGREERGRRSDSRDRDKKSRRRWEADLEG